MGRKRVVGQQNRFLEHAPLICAALLGVGLVADGWQVTVLMALMGIPVVFLARRSRHLNLARMQAERRHAGEMAELHLRTIEALAVAIDAKDNTTHEHLRRVLLYVEAIGVEMKLPEPEMNALRAAGLLHDIGKLAVPEYIISKPGRLTEEEFEKMKIHTVVGAEILERVQFPYPVVPIVRSHHERWNGTGYPDGLKGTEIPVGARILALVDCFDALASDRQYRRALSPEEAIKVIRQESGKAFDPFIAGILERIYPEMEARALNLPQIRSGLSTKVKIEKGAAPQVGLSVETNRDASSAINSIAQAKEELRILYDLTQALGKSLSVDDTLPVLAEELQKLIRFDTVAIYLVQGPNLVPRLVDGVNDYLLSRWQIPVGQGLSGWVAGNGKCSLNGNPSVEPGYDQCPAECQLRSALSVPLDSSNGIVGALTLYSRTPAAFTVDNLRILKTIGLKAGQAINNALLHEQLERNAETDGLTGLPNARALTARLEQESKRATRHELPYTVFVIDLNSLKKINDQLGHLAGNQALQRVAAALRGCLREYDFLARMGGDEFVVLLPGMPAEATAEKRIELSQAVQALEPALPDTPLSISMGSATFPADGSTPEQLLGLADRRMYWHKREFYKSRAASAAQPSEMVSTQ